MPRSEMDRLPDGSPPFSCSICAADNLTQEQVAEHQQTQEHKDQCALLRLAGELTPYGRKYLETVDRSQWGHPMTGFVLQERMAAKE
jgi:hypothetical protein